MDPGSDKKLLVLHTYTEPYTLARIAAFVTTMMPGYTCCLFSLKNNPARVILALFLLFCISSPPLNLYVLLFTTTLPQFTILLFTPQNFLLPRQLRFTQPQSL